jgi:hypothetical protein
MLCRLGETTPLSGSTEACQPIEPQRRGEDLAWRFWFSSRPMFVDLKPPGPRLRILEQVEIAGESTA